MENIPESLGLGLEVQTGAQYRETYGSVALV